MTYKKGGVLCVTMIDGFLGDIMQNCFEIKLMRLSEYLAKIPNASYDMMTLDKIERKHVASSINRTSFCILFQLKHSI